MNISTRQSGIKLGVCMITSSHLPKVGGTQKQAQQLAKRLKDKGIDCCIVTRNHLKIEPFEVIDGVELYRVPAWGGTILASITFIISSLTWLFKNRRRFQLLHCHQLHSPSTIGLVAKFIWGKKVVGRVTRSGRFGEISEINRLPFPKARLKMLRSLDRIVALNNESLEELKEAGLPCERIVLIPNGTEVNGLANFNKQQLRKELNLPSGKIVIYTAGHLDESKGVDTLLKAWALVKQRTEEVTLVLLGEGRLFDKLKYSYSLLKDKGIEFFGCKRDTMSYTACADLFVQPSLSEGISNSLLEAMSFRLGIVATNIGGNRDLIKNGKNGLLVVPGNDVQLAQAIIHLLNDEDLARRMGEQAYLDVRENYSMDRCVERYCQLYEEVLTG